jgi:hypothetical protein
MTTPVALLDAIRAHLAAFEVPAGLASVLVTNSVINPEITVQLSAPTTPEIAAALLAWADTLAEVTAHAWQAPGGRFVHLSVTGRLPGGAVIRVYGCTPVTGSGLDTDLSPGDPTPVPLATVRAWATLPEVPAP